MTPDPWLEQFEAERGRRKQRAKDQRTLVVEGEALTVKPTVAPEIAFDLADFEQRLLDQIRRNTEAANKGDAPSYEISDRDMVAAAEAAIRACLEPESLPAWERLRAPDHPDPLTTSDIFLIASRLLAKATALPTDAPVDSSNGRARTANTSTAASRSRARTRKH